jgi:hypothetical protein
MAALGGKSQTAAQAPATLGWNFVHATYCDFFYDGTEFVLVVYPQEGGAWSTAYGPVQQVLEPQCSQGNLVAFYVFNSNGDWNQIFTYSYR